MHSALIIAAWAAVLPLAAAEGSASPLPSTLAEDDECSVAGPDGDHQAGCALSALQRRGSVLTAAKGGAATAAPKESEGGASFLDAGCVDAKPGDACYTEVKWAMTDGLRSHPEWYPGLTAASSVYEFQDKVHNSAPGKCPMPCSLRASAKWCAGAPPAKLWAAEPVDPPMKVKILSYNLFWWSLFGKRKGNGNSAGKLIKAASADEPFDVMGFQECEDPERVLGPVGLLEDYTPFQGEHAVCMAFRKKTWTLLAKGVSTVAEDMKSHYYGKRGAQWVRLKHTGTGGTLFFVNHHGPLEVNSGGECGGTATADNLVKLMHAHAEPGDTIVLVGDFNANSASLTLQTLWSRLVLVYSGDSFGGVDNIFSNVNSSSVMSTKTLGSGGSDHDAISAVVQVGGAPIGVRSESDPEAFSAVKALTTNPPGDDWQVFWCGLLEADLDYAVAPGGWGQTIHHGAVDVASPQRCCRLCQRDTHCKSWTWADDGPQCRLFGATPTTKVVTPGFVSGLPAVQAALEAKSAARKAIGVM